MSLRNLGHGCVGIALLGALACHRTPAGGPGSRTIESNAGHYRVTLTPLPDPIPRGQLFDVRVTVDPVGPSTGTLEVTIDARMPEHFHGMNRLALITREGPRTWLASGLFFHMPGHWELYADITEEGRTERAQIDVELR